jgi:hypothetical protein
MTRQVIPLILSSLGVNVCLSSWLPSFCINPFFFCNRLADDPDLKLLRSINMIKNCLTRLKSRRRNSQRHLLIFEGSNFQN